MDRNAFNAVIGHNMFPQLYHAVYCYNINWDISIAISNRNVLMHFYYVDDVIDSFCSQLGSNAPAAQDGITTLAPEMIYTITQGELSDHFFEFRKLQKNGQTPVFENEFQQRLYATYQSYQKE